MTSKAKKQRAGGEVKRLSVLQEDDLLATMASYMRLGHFSLHYLTGEVVQREVAEPHVARHRRQ
jgi:hypothetical protein